MCTINWRNWRFGRAKLALALICCTLVPCPDDEVDAFQGNIIVSPKQFAYLRFYYSSLVNSFFSFQISYWFKKYSNLFIILNLLFIILIYFFCLGFLGIFLNHIILRLNFWFYLFCFFYKFTKILKFLI